MKTLFAFLAILSLAATLAAQEPIPVYLDPASDAPRIGELQDPSLAAPASWPVGSEAIPGWMPVRYRGAFEVYVSNNDIAKDLSVKPGRPYLLRPAEGAPQLAVAGEDEQSDILSVDSLYCKLRLETTVTGYIRAETEAATIRQEPRPSSSASGHAGQTKQIEGQLVAVGQLEKTRVGQDYKLVGPTGAILAYLDLSRLSDLVRLRELVGQNVRAGGRLSEAPEGHLVLAARTLKKTN